MLEALGGFFDRLRARGVALAPSEATDALRALAGVGIESRPAVRLALLLTCAKDRREREVVGEEFDRYFVAPPGTRRGEAEAPGGEGEGGRGGEGRGLVRAAPAAPRERAERARRVEPRAPRGRTRNQGRLAEELRRGTLARRQRLRHLLLDRSATRASRAPAAEAGAARAALNRLDLRSPAAREAERLLAEEAARLLAELRLRHGRRLQPGRRGRLALRRTLRASLRTGGVPFVLARERRRRRLPRLVLLVDVSHSVALASGLFLLLATEFLEAVARTTVFAFVDRAVEATRALRVWARGGHAAGRPGGSLATFTDLVRAAHDLDPSSGLPRQLDLTAPSDYGRAFYGLLAERAFRGPSSDLVLVVLGDGRTNFLDPQGWAFAELARRARKAIWLVPERPERWGTGDSALGAYLPEVDLAVEAADLAGLVRGLRAVLREVGR